MEVCNPARRQCGWLLGSLRSVTLDGSCSTPHYRFLLVGSEIPDEESQTRSYSLTRAVIGGAAILRCLDHFLSIPVLCYLVKWKARLEFVKRSLGVSFSWHLFTSMHGLVGRRRRLGRSSKHPFRS